MNSQKLICKPIRKSCCLTRNEERDPFQHWMIRRVAEKHVIKLDISLPDLMKKSQNVHDELISRCNCNRPTKQHRDGLRLLRPTM
jgi:hypothetical protein